MSRRLYAPPQAARLHNTQAFAVAHARRGLSQWIAGVSLVLGACAALPLAAAPSSLAPMAPETLVSEVLAANPGLSAMREAVVAAEARIVSAGSLSDPLLAGHLAPRTVDGFKGSGGQRRRVTGIVEISQALPWPGTLALRRDAAQHEAQARGDDLEALRLRLAAAARSGYAEWVYVHRALAINADNQQLSEELRRVAERRYAAGIAQQQDVLAAEVQLQRLKKQALELQRRKADVRARTNALLGYEANRALAPPVPLAPATALPNYESLRASALRRHPALGRLDRRIAASRDREGLAEKAFLPDLKLIAGHNGLRPAPDARFTIGVGLSLPLARDKRDAELDAARADTMRLHHEQRDYRSRLLGRLEAARSAAESARATVSLYEQQLVPRIREALSAARAAYGSGGGSFLEVITAEQDKLNAELNLERARADYFIARAEAIRWSGGELPTTGTPPNDEASP